MTLHPRRLTSHHLSHALASSAVYYLFPAFWFSLCVTHHPWTLYPAHHLQFVAWTVAPHPSDSEPWRWGNGKMGGCDTAMPYCRVLWTFAHALAAVTEVPQLSRLYEAGRRVGRGRDEGVMASAALFALSKFMYLPSYIVM